MLINGRQEALIEMQYEVEEVVGRRVYSGKVLYLVKWRNFPREESTWESIKVLKNVKHFVKEYNDKNKHEDDEDGKDKSKVKRGRPKKTAIVKEREDIQLPEPDIYYESDEERKNEPESCPKQSEKAATEAEEQKTEEKLEQSLKCSENEQTECELAHAPQLCSPQSVTGVTKATAMTVPAEKKLKKIYFIEKAAGGKIQYLVEYSDGNLVKCETEQLLEKFPKELIAFLEESLLSKK